MELDLTRIFVKVVQNGSFTKAAQILKVPKSTVSKSVARLEKETGTKLIVRTTRSLTLTSAGRLFFEASLGPIQALEEAQKSLSGSDSILSGFLRVTAPEDLGANVIAPVIAKLTAENSGLSFELRYTDQVLDLVKDGIDIAVRLGRLNESRFKVKKAGEVILIAVATQKYLKARSKIREPQDLSEHDCLSISSTSLLNRWPLKNGSRHVNVPVKTKISCNQMDSLINCAKAHGGIALVPRFMAQPEVDAGNLIRVLPEWHTPPLPVSIISPQSAQSSARLKITIDKIYEALQEAL